MNQKIKHKKIISIAVGLILLCIGIVLVVVNAASPFASLQASQIAASGTAKVVTDDSASAGKALQFGPAVVQPEPPAPAGFPDASNTGWRHTGVTLRNCGPANGFLETSNATYDSCYFPNGIVVIGANITITRSHIHGVVQGHYTKDWNLQNLKMTDVEIEEATNMSPDRAAIEGAAFHCLRCNVHHTGTGIHLGENSSVIDSWTHDFIMTPGAHGAGIAATNGNGDHSKVIHNNIECNRLPGQDQVCSSALSLYSEPTIDDVLVQNNLFNTVGGYCAYAGAARGTNIRFIDNKFGKKYNSKCGTFGPVAVYYPGNTGNVWRGNVWQDTGQAINP